MATTHGDFESIHLLIIFLPPELQVKDEEWGNELENFSN
jgi:hypothetical protein